MENTTPVWYVVFDNGRYRAVEEGKVGSAEIEAEFDSYNEAFYEASCLNIGGDL